ncbi:MAG TPA: fumarylacetoacetate hydrolase family protein [Candidatus Limnocylindrales bacterium]|jgi:2-keto-4-pentenoate hydratase/2-oxohepta-3-ene-1,7-dioic acid hydratase in catechol pathway
MRLYAHQDRRGDDRLGALVDGELLTAGQLQKHERDRSMLTWQSVCCVVNVDGWRAGLEATIRRAVRKGATRIDPERRRPIAAVQHPGKIVCVGLNYGGHVAEGGRATPLRPLLFAKFANTIIGDGDAIVRPPGTQALDLEVELGVVIGRRARRVREEDALSCVAGYVVTNDVSARDWQGTPQALREGEKGDGQWLRAKGSDTFLPIGPVFVTPDEVDPAAGLRIRSWRIPGHGDGAGVPVLMQDGNTADLLSSVPRLISYISQQITLDPGDLVITGTPAGVGVFRDPPVFLVPGDRVRCEIEGIGVVENPVVDWTDDPRRDA